MRRFARAFLVWSLLCAPALAYDPAVLVDEPWIGAPFTAAPSDVLAAAESIAAATDGDAGRVTLWQDERIRFDDEGRKSHELRRVEKILHRDAAQHPLEISWPVDEQRPEIHIRVISLGGEEILLQNEDLQETNDGGTRKLVARPPGVDVGAVIETEIARRAVRAPSGGDVWISPLAEEAPVHRGRLIVESPLRLPLRYSVREHRLTPEKERLENSFRLRFDYDSIDAFEAEPDLPGGAPRGPQIIFSTGRDWPTAASALAALFDGVLLMNDATALLQELDLPDDDAQSERIEGLLAAVRERIETIDRPWRGRAPAAPAATWASERASTTDVAALLIAAFRAWDLPAYPALVRAAPAQDVPRGLPGVGLFDRVLVYLPGARPLWIDPADSTASIGRLTPPSEGRWALIGSPSTESLIRTPTSQSIDHRIEIVREIDLADFGPGRISERTTFRGAFEQMHRKALGKTDAETRRRAQREYVRSAFRAADLGEVEESDPRDFSQPPFSQVEALHCEAAVTDLHRAIVAVSPSGLWNRLPSQLRTPGPPRRGDLAQSIPFVADHRYRIRVPDGFSLRERPQDLERSLGPARFSRRLKVDADGDVTLHLRFDSGVRILSPEDAEALRREILAFEAEGPLLLWFDHDGAGDDLRESFAADRRLIAAHPDDVIHRIRFARRLAAAGLTDAARDHARRATENRPTSALAYQALADALMRGPLGRPYHEGWDRRLTVAAYERALQLNPNDSISRRELARTLEHDDDGRRFGPAAEIDRALALYAEAGQDVALDHLSTLAILGRWNELAARAQEISSGDLAFAALKLAAKAVLDGPQSALDTARRIAPDETSRWALLGTSARYLLLSRRYQEASRFFSVAAAGAPDPPAVLSQAEAVGRAVRHESIPIDEEDPASWVRELVALVGLPETRPEKIADVFHTDFLRLRGSTRSELRTIFSALRQVWFSGSSSDLTPEVAVDLAIASLRAEVDGSIERGHRFTLTTLSGNVAEVFVSFDDEADGYRVVAVDRDAGQLGAEALRRLARRDLIGVRQWLGWAYDLADDDDPFSEFWPGAETEDDTETLELAAALWMAGGPEIAQAEGVLRDVLASTHDDLERRLTESALTPSPAAGDELARAVLERPDAATEEHLQSLETAARTPSPRQSEILLALAAARAERGDVAAIEILRRSIDAADRALPEGGDWYVPARLAQVWGLTEISRSLYERALGDHALGAVARQRSATLPKSKKRSSSR